MKLKACKMSMLPPQTGPNLFLITKPVYTIIIIKYNYIYIYIFTECTLNIYKGKMV